ncbi:fibronectin type III domain-containing protein [Clostridium estertheticum]|uniref:fibronectin type III domain-containing protein n=1 Tax=Clostridium estertheticum TaxID=238834 RepID=UPI001C0ADA65|nr:fibronectin type III domain-containing protein [Clostridium estertheticum]MBU3218419.1 fibronectin type III domain-containing protein [Clostridium estertheticum]WAG57434.1 fibronectin type III domain-containing protein [Clostridium estertheticum]
MRNRNLSLFIATIMIFTLLPFNVKGVTKVATTGGEAILDLENVNQVPIVKFSALKDSNNKMIISNDSTIGGFSSKGTKNSSFLLTPNKISGDFSVEATLKVTNRTINGTGGIVGVGAFSGTQEGDAMVTSVARGDNGSRSYYKKTTGYGAGGPNTSKTSEIGSTVLLKIQRTNNTYTSTINGEVQELADLHETTNGPMYLGFVICGANAEVDKFIIKQNENVIYNLSKKSLPRPTLTAKAKGDNVDINWTGTQGAQNYIVQYREMGTSSWTTDPDKITGKSHTVTNLTAMKAYEFRVKASGGESNGLTSALAIAVPGFRWSSIASPLITGVVLSEDGKEVKVSYNNVMGALGTLKLDVEMRKDNIIVDTKSVVEADTLLGATDGEVTFSPKESGTYTFTAKALRTAQEDVKLSNTKNITFKLPLTSPVVSASATATGSIKVKWDQVKEAQEYNLKYKKEADSQWTTAIESTKDLAYTVNNLQIEGVYNFKLTVIKDGQNSATTVSAKSKEVLGETAEWKSIIFGQSISSLYNTIDVDSVKGAVTVTAGNKEGSTTGGKVTGSHDGIAYYYTEVDPSKNFELSADIKVNYFAKGTPDNQEAFGIMARDDIGKSLDPTVFSSNMVLVGGYRGLVQSVFRNNVNDKSGTGATMDDVFKFGDRPLNDGTSTYKMTLKKTNTGYQVSVNNGVEKIYYKPKQMEVLNSGKIYVGFFAARVASITSSNISMKTSDVVTDPAAVKESQKPVDAAINVVSLMAASTSSYKLDLLANVKGNVEVKQNGVEIYKGPIKANDLLGKTTTLINGDNNFDITLIPEATENVTKYDPISIKYTVTLKQYGTLSGAIYVSQTGSSKSAGTKMDPTDIYSAVKFIGEGQTIYVRGGVYNLKSPIIIERGNDSKSNNPKMLSAYPNEKPIFDFGFESQGLSLAGSGWKIYGINITKANLKGMNISGSNNIVELVNVYNTLETGIQISGSSTESKDKWPSNNLVLNCTAYDNVDVSENNADGFAAKLTSGEGNVFRGCISHNNCDDGWDLYSKLETGAIGAVVIENSIAYGNGTLTNGRKTNGDGNGFKMGGEGIAVKHVLRNCLSFNNNSDGVTSNSNPAIIVENTTSVDNKGINFSFAFYTAAKQQFSAKNNISFRTTAGAADNVPASIESDSNYFYNGKESINKKGKVLLKSDFTSVVQPNSYNRNEDGTIFASKYMSLLVDSTIKSGAYLSDISKITNPIPNDGTIDEKEPIENEGLLKMINLLKMYKLLWMEELLM